MESIHTFVVLAYKESKYLEDCIRSVLNQSVKSNVVIATTTMNDYIKNIALKYNLDIIEASHTNIGGDFDFALNSVDTELVTIAHQDDKYESDYSEKVLSAYKKYNDSLIIFTDYYEIRNDNIVKSNINLKIKRFLLFPLRFHKISGLKLFKRNSLRFGNSICCPSVTFVKNNCPDAIFSCNMTCDVDWFAWEKLSKLKGKFIFINRKLMGHRIDVTTTTTKIINSGVRRNEDLFMFKKFWPSFLAKFINKFYSKSEKSNKL